MSFALCIGMHSIIHSFLLLSVKRAAGSEMLITFFSDKPQPRSAWLEWGHTLIIMSTVLYIIKQV